MVGFYEVDDDLDYEFQVEIDGVNYGMDVLTEARIKQPLFDKVSVGLACCAEMTVSYYVGTLPEPSKGAMIVPRFRPKRDTEPPFNWMQLGVFYIDLRKTRAGKQTLICYDSMMRADVKFLQDDVLLEDWPQPMGKVAEDIRIRMGLNFDPRTKINETYTIDYPNEANMRDILMYIAAAHAGNWIITSRNELLLVPLVGSMPPETWFLIEEHGKPIVFGDTRIVIDPKGVS